MSSSVSILGMDFPVQIRDCRLSISKARLITGTPTTGKTTMCGVLRTLSVPTLESDEYVRTFAPEWNRDRLWMRKDATREMFENRMRAGFAAASVRCLLQPSGCVVTNWMGDDLFPFLQNAAYGGDPYVRDAVLPLQLAGLQHRQVDGGGFSLARLPVVFVRASSVDVRRLSAGRMGQGTWAGGIPEALVNKWSLLWSPQDLSARYSRVVYLGLPVKQQSHLYYEFESGQGTVVFASLWGGGHRYLCRLSRTMSSSLGEPTAVDFFFVAFGEGDRLVAVDSVEDDLFISDVVGSIYGFSGDTGFSFDPVTIAWATEAARQAALQVGQSG